MTARYPQQLATALGAGLRPVREGVYEVEALTRRIRIVVANPLPRRGHNAMLLLFSAKDELLRYGAEHYRVRSPETSSLLEELFKRYRQEILTMPDLLEEFTRETIDQLLKELPPEELRKRLSVRERLEGLSAEEREKLLRLLKANGGSATPGDAAPSS